jgi:hypothetical protein
MSVRSTIASQFQQASTGQERTPSPLSGGLRLVQSGLDCLRSAIIAARLLVPR